MAAFRCDEQSGDGPLQSRECEGGGGYGEVEPCGLQECELGRAEVGLDAGERGDEAERIGAPEPLKGGEVRGEGDRAHFEDDQGGLCGSGVEVEPFGVVKSEDAARCDGARSTAHGLLDGDGGLEGTHDPNGPALAFKGRIRAFRRSWL